MNLSAPQPVTECSPVMSPDFSFVSGPETSWPPSGKQADLLAFHVDEPLNNSTRVSLTTVPCWKILLNCWCFSPPFCVTVYKAYLSRRRWIWEAFPPLFVCFFGKWTDKYVNTRPWIYGLWFCALLWICKYLLQHLRRGLHRCSAVFLPLSLGGWDGICS